jgi:hypothetical protein
MARIPGPRKSSNVHVASRKLSTKILPTVSKFRNEIPSPTISKHAAQLEEKGIMIAIQSWRNEWSWIG